MSESRSGRGGLAAALALVVIALMVGPKTPSRAQVSGASDLVPLATCVRAEKSLSILLVFDESRSLLTTDGGARRVIAATALTRALSRLAERDGGTGSVVVDIGLAGFAQDFRMYGGWTQLTPASEPGLEAHIADRFSEPRESAAGGNSTDFNLALRGARRELLRHAASSETAGGCQAFVLFTDGKYDISPSRPGQIPYAPDISGRDSAAISQAIELGKQDLCRDGGIADQIRSDGVILLAVALTRDIATQDQSFIQSLAVGNSADERCGAQSSLGAYFNAEEDDALIRLFDEIGNLIDEGTKLPPITTTPGPSDCAMPPCLRAEFPVTVDGAISHLHILAETSVDGAGIQIVGPEPEPGSITIEYPRGESSRLAGAQIVFSWLSPQALDLDLYLPPETRDQWLGEWHIRFLDMTGDDPSITGTAQIFVYGGLAPEIARDLEFTLDTPSEIVVALVDERGDPAPESTLTSAAAVSGTVQSVEGDEMKPLVFTRRGSDFVASYTPARPTGPSVAVPAELTVSVTLNTSISGLPLTPVSDVLSVPLRTFIDGPTFTPTALNFGRLTTQQGESDAVAILTIRGGRDAACLWFTGGGFTKKPEGVTAVDIATEPTAASADECLSIGPREIKEVQVLLHPTGSGYGKLAGDVVAHVRLDGQADSVLVDIPASLVMYVKPNAGVLLGAELLFLAFGLLVPLALQYLLNRRNSYFRPAELLRVASLPVRVTEREVLDLSVSSDGRPLASVPPSAFHMLEGSEEKRQTFEYGLLMFEAKTERRPLFLPYGEVSARGALVATSEGRSISTSTRVPLVLSGTWAFVVEAAGSETSDSGATSGATGRLFVFSEEPAYQSPDMVTDVIATLPGILASISSVEVGSRVDDKWGPASTAGRTSTNESSESTEDYFGWLRDPD